MNFRLYDKHGAPNIGTIHIQPGKPTQNGHVESFTAGYALFTDSLARATHELFDRLGLRQSAT
jgi:hypothetical protein